jgi:subfamily B ATP-binding cassette protein MsbA
MRSAWLFFWILLFNFLGACLEGIAYLFVILSFSALEPSYSINQAKLLSFFENIFFIFPITKNSFITFLIMGLVAQIFKSLFCFFATCLSARLTLYLQHSTQSKIYKKIIHFSFEKVNRYKMGTLTSSLQAPVSYYRYYLEYANQAIICGFLICVSIAILISISWKLTGIVLSLFALSFFLQKKVVKKNHTLSSDLCSEIEAFNVHTTQTLQGLRFIHLYSLQDFVVSKMAGIVKKMALFSKRMVVLNGASTAFNEMMGIILISICLLMGYFVLESGSGLLPTLLGFITITYRLTGRVTTLSNSLNQMGALSGYRTSIKEMLHTEDEIISRGKKKFTKFKNEIKCEALDFAYDPLLPKVLENIDLTIKRGSVVALVGKSGSGKSSFVDLLTGLYLPTGGKISLDGHNLSSFNLSSYRQRIGVVSQETFLFNESIADNIRLGDLSATQEQIEEATKNAHAHEFIMKLKEGYQSVIGEKGYRLSGGEKQRIALARALLRKCDILILDEATSSLDNHSEKLISEALTKFYGEKTVILIAHRLSTVMHADQIFVLDEGKIVEQGTHIELIEKGGAYAQQWNLQFGDASPQLINELALGLY